MINQELNLSKSNNIPSNKSNENENQSYSESFESKESISSNNEDIRKRIWDCLEFTIILLFSPTLEPSWHFWEWAMQLMAEKCTSSLRWYA